MKKKIVILSSVFLAFLTLGIWLNTQRGVYYSDKFWRENGESVFVAGNGDRVKYVKDGANIDFDLRLGGKDITAVAWEKGDKIEMEFSDGWTAVLYDLAEDVALPFDDRDEIIINDINKMGLKFSLATGNVRREPFYDEDGVIIGESLILETQSGDDIYAGTNWRASGDDYVGDYYHYDAVDPTYYNIEKSSDKMNIVTLENGSRLKINDYDTRDMLFENGRSEYLLDTHELFNISAGGTAQERTWFARFLVELTRMRVDRRGELYAVFMYVVLYAAGAFTFLFPEKMAFWGSRWRFKNDPELSESGLQVEMLSGLVVMAASLFLTFVPVLVYGV